MKKIITILLAAIIPVAILAQDNNTRQYVPEEGDFAVGIDVIPLLNFIGNAFNATEYNEIDHLGGTPPLNGHYLLPDVSIMGKYLITDEWAVRANVGVMISSINYRGYSIDQEALLLNPLSQDKVLDIAKHNRNGLSLSLGAEYRKGNKRIQGIFGANLLFAFTKESLNYTWGNQMTTVNQTPESYFSDVYVNGYRILSEQSVGANFYGGITGNIGFEWFIAPEISLGAEVNLSVYYLAGTQTYVTSEGYNRALDKVEIRTDILEPGDNGIVFGTSNLGGSLFMMFYF